MRLSRFDRWRLGRLLRRAERALDGPYDATVSLIIDAIRYILDATRGRA
ncbi:MAG: hypothetical protein ACOWWM_09485 [Desulfobacterales bacterium]